MNTTRPGIVLIVLGLLFGPAYYAYWQYLGGEEVGRYELRERGDRWTLPDGSIQRFVGHFAYQPLVLELTPEHNEVRLRLSFHAADGAQGENRYQATVFDDDYPVLQRDFAVALTSGAARTVDLSSFAVRRPNQHLLVIEELGKPAAEVTHVTITVLQGVQHLDRLLLWSGAAMLLTGIGLVAWPALSHRARR